MTAPRRLTRGSGEKTQIRQLRGVNSNTSKTHRVLDPSPENLTVTPGGLVVALRAYSNTVPGRIDSCSGYINASSTNTYNIPYTGHGIGHYGRGITTAFFFSESIRTARSGELRNTNFYNHKWRYFSTNFSGVASYSANCDFRKPFVNNTPYVFIDRLVSLAVNSNDKVLLGSSIATFDKTDYLSMRKGGILTRKNRDIDINNNVSIRIQVNDIKNTSILSPTGAGTLGLSNATVHTQLFEGNGFNNNGGVTLQNINENELCNLNWLLKQKTQYQTKFDPLITIGA